MSLPYFSNQMTEKKSGVVRTMFKKETVVKIAFETPIECIALKICPGPVGLDIVVTLVYSRLRDGSITDGGSRT